MWLKKSVGLAGLAVLGVGAPCFAEDSLQLGRNPGECEISAALGIAKPGCPAVMQRLPALKQPPPAPVVVVVEPLPPPPPPPPPPTPFSASFQIAFEFGSAKLSPDSLKLLERIGHVLGSPEAAKVRFRIVGHTDGVGRAKDNLRLSRQRAATVRDYLVRHAGMSVGRFEVVGRGATELLNANNPAAAENRRVEIANLGQ